jgi:hypothetical protein
VPRLSILIPYRHDDQRLEATLLSVLENRPKDCEIIVVHDGSYTNPYCLDDEVVFIDESPRSSTVQLLNTGMLAACSPIVCTVLDGVDVTPGWADQPLDLLERQELAAVAVPTFYGQSSRPLGGIRARALALSGGLLRAKVELNRTEGEVAGPNLTCGFIKKKILLTLGGWDAALDVGTADVELACALQELGLECALAANSHAQADASCSRAPTNIVIKQLAELSVAYGFSSAGTAAAMSDMLRGCLSGSVSAAVAWASGVMANRAADRVNLRLNAARTQLEQANQEVPLRLYGAEQASGRRAA